MGKTLGYIIAFIGLIGISAWAIPEVKEAIPFLEPFSDTMLLSISIVVIILGLFVVTKSSSKGPNKGKLIPIYKGKKIVGYNSD